jgi:hypothetical protein
MREASLTEIRTKAMELHDKGAAWHFHILLPNCLFNENPSKYAFILETLSTDDLVHYSDLFPNELGAELAPLAHKADVLNQSSTAQAYTPTQTMQRIIERAKELNQQGVKWHHHVTFPACKYYSGNGGFVLIFEDPVTGKSIESTTDEEPIDDLKQIEPLFYAQK